MKQRSFLVFSFYLLASLVPARAQQDTIYNENVIVTGAYKPEIELRPKMLVAPTTSDTLMSLHHQFGYSVHPQRLTSIFDPSRIKAARIIAEPKSRLFHNYLRVGMGNYWSPMLEASYNSTANRLTTYGARLTHNSSWGKIGDADSPAEYYGANHYSQTDLDLFGQHILKGKYQLYGNFHYDNDYNMFYGFSDTTLNRYQNLRHGYPADSIDNWRDDLKNSDLKSMYNYFRFGAGFRSLPSKYSSWNYDALLNVDDLMGSLGHNEFGLNLNGIVTHSFSSNTSKTIDNASVSLRMRWNQYHQQFDLKNLPLGYNDTIAGVNDDSRNRALVNINPFATFSVAKFNVHLGAALSINQYSRPNAPHTYLLPDVTVSRSFAAESITLTAGALGTDTPNTWNDMRLANPYAIGSDDVRSVRHYTYFLAAHYKIVKRLHLDAKASYNLYHDYMTYELDPRFELNNVFRPKYESFSQTVLGADLTFINDEMISLTLGATYYSGEGLDEDTLPGLYHPNYDIHLVTHINYNDKLLFHLQALVLSEMNAAYAYDATSQKYVFTETVPLRYNFNAEAEYRYNRALSFFLRIENIACQRYQYWLNYPSQRIRFTLGATYTF